jgi:pantoate kinase
MCPDPIATSITVEVPHRISGFFEIVDHSLPPEPALDDLASIGSRGGGPCLSACGTTRVDIDPDGEPGSVSISINGEDCSESAKTTRSVLKWMGEGWLADNAISIVHEFPMQPGSGYGSSGCGATGTAIALNLLFDVGYTLGECGKFAHCAEVENRTGLGTVGGLITGGCTITMAPGYPFAMNTIVVPSVYRIACATRGSLSTAQILSDPKCRKVIIRSGRVAMDRITEKFSIEHYMRVAIDFVKDTGMLGMPELDLGGVKNIMDILNGASERGILGASMNQLGKSVYCVYAPREGSEEFIASSFQENGFPVVKFLHFHETGPRVLEFVRRKPY